MHFIFEALHKRPLEKRSLAVSRGVTAITMGLVFLAYVGYLIYQVYNDRTLLILSSRDIPVSGYLAPDVEICFSGNWTISHCSFQYMDWSMKENPGCTNFYSNGSGEGPVSCKVFKAGDANFGIIDGGKDVENRPLRRVDIYWRMDNVTAATEASFSIPSVAISLYDQSFSTWRLSSDQVNAMIPKQQSFFNSSRLGAYRATSMQNYTSAVYFYPLLYRAIDPGNVASLFGFQNSYVDIKTLRTSQHNWPIRPNPNITRGDYHGRFSVRLATTNIEVQTEQRQHTILAALALMGGAYGVLTTIYIVVFGTPRLTPWGVVHRFPLVFSKGKDKLGLNKNNFDSSSANQQYALNSTNTATATSTSMKQPLFKRWKQKFNYTPAHKNIRDDTSDEYLNPNHKSTDTCENTGRPTPLIPKNTPTENDNDDSIKNVTTIENINDIRNTPNSIYNSLEYRIEELEMILREYFLNVEYLDDLRLRHRQQRQSLERSDLPLYQASIQQQQQQQYQTQNENGNNNNNNINNESRIRNSITPLPQKAFVLPDDDKEKSRKKSFTIERKNDDTIVDNNSRISIAMKDIHQDNNNSNSS
ncbi:hypothetical protein BJ944DRAFT_267222 [Cunninghamella echinulata]|nr:hypothetical protein BJ944DRAFT_267222 [Cunninghamella echinulata]